MIDGIEHLPVKVDSGRVRSGPVYSQREILPRDWLTHVSMSSIGAWLIFTWMPGIWIWVGGDSTGGNWFVL